MKALLINESPRPHGCTYTALTELKRTLEAEGIEVELIHVGNKDIRGCIACRKCHETGKCVFDDKELRRKVMRHSTRLTERRKLKRENSMAGKRGVAHRHTARLTCNEK